MPELPEVQTVVNGLTDKIVGLKIKDVWTDYNSKYYLGKKSIKDPKFFRKFKKEIVGAKVVEVQRRAKNILIFLDNQKVILVHLKMTGHFLFGKYTFNKKEKTYIPEGGFVDPKKLKKDKNLQKQVLEKPLTDPFNKFIHFVIDFEKYQLTLSDMRKFASVTLLDKNEIPEIFRKTGPEIFDLSKKDFLKIFENKKGKIKTVFMNPEVVAGIGNIYSDEILWEIGVHPESEVSKIPEEKFGEMLAVSKKILKKSIASGGDSMSDFRNIEGKKGKFQNSHKAYKLEKTKCQKKNCCGIIEKKQIGQRIGRFCKKHQIKY
ncbi:hypothetical protein CSB11_01700 [Candidatus Campbellbacteria bacterium]|nr:MAG: hypothetical protein CSB11_01700 [Candidatus Campbellbacteria bacterium]